MELVLYPINIEIQDAFKIYEDTGQYFILKNGKIYIGFEENN